MPAEGYAGELSEEPVPRADDTRLTAPAAALSVDGGMRRLRGWAHGRSVRYLANRMTSVLGRYGVRPDRAERRTLAFVSLLDRYGCSPTLAVPGRVARRHAAFVRKLQERGVELAIHGFDHIDFRTLDPSEITAQLTKAAAAFEANHIRFSGFRCPYLSYDPTMAALVPPGVFAYSSNEAIEWHDDGAGDDDRNPLYDTLSRFYRASPSSVRPAVPRSRNGLVEIPVAVPDDLQVLDGSGGGGARLTEMWVDILQKTHSRGEAFVVLTHPETASSAADSFRTLLEEARHLSPSVWITRLHEVGEWWRHRRSMVVELRGDVIHIEVPDGGTLLGRNVSGCALGMSWDSNYRVVGMSALDLPKTERWPFVGVADDVPPWVVPVLEDEGYVVRVGGSALDCATTLDGAQVDRVGSELGLVKYLDTLTTPMVRLWRWPEGARSVLCVTGDLDALSLVDYADRALAVGPFARS